MDDTRFQEYLNDRYQGQVGWYDRKANQNKRIYQALQWGVILLASSLPVLISALPDGDVWKGATTGIAILLAVGTAGLKTFKYQESWLTYRGTAEMLEREKYFFEARVGPYAAAADPQAMFVESAETLMLRENAGWAALHRKGDSTDRTSQSGAFAPKTS